MPEPRQPAHATSATPVRLAIAGLGPAGVGLALRAVERGWDVVCHDLAIADGDVLPPWPATYGAVDPDTPPWAAEFFAPSAPLTVIAETRCELGFRYRMLNKEALRNAFRRANIPVRRSPAPASSRTSVTVTCSGAPRTDDALWQIAAGVVVSLSDATSQPTPEPIFMDWRGRADHHPPSFLYVQQVDDGWLFEETILAAHCPADASEQQRLVDMLRARLAERLDSSEVRALGPWTQLRTEAVSIPMGTRRGALPDFFGAAGGLIHPATGYSLGASLTGADDVLDMIERTHGTSGHGRQDALMCANRLCTRTNRWLAYVLRQVGGELIARADQETLRSFFECFFRLPAPVQLAYLTGHDGVAVAKAMWQLRAHTGFRHEFLRPLWTQPWPVARAVWKRMRARR